MHIVAFEVEAWERPAFAPLLAQHQVELYPEPLTEENAARFAGAQVISTFIYSELSRAVLSQLPGLQLIATRSTGYDHIDLAYCRERHVTLCNVPRYGTATVAEHVFGLLLTISHRLEEAVDRTRKGDFSPRGLQGFDLEGKTLGIVGTGAIGKHVARIAHGFGMTVLAYDAFPDEEAARLLQFHYVGFDELLRRADILTLHVPATPASRHLIGAEQFARMKPGAVLINTARGEVVDTPALVRALAEGKLAAAGLDVLAQEPVIREEAELLRSVYEQTHDLRALLADQVLLRLRNVVVTPHSAFNTREAVARILETTVGNIAAFAAGRPQNVVPLDAA